MAGDHPTGMPERKQRSVGEDRINRIRSLPVGWAALVIICAGIVWAVFATLTGRLDFGSAGFEAGVVLMGTLLGLAVWDLFVTLGAMRYAVYLALPEQITLKLSRRVVPVLSPAAFLIGILIGHQYWH